MVGMYGLDGLHGLSGPQPIRKASAPATGAVVERGDTIDISKEALAAAAVSAKAEAAESSTPSVVEERIAAAKKSIEEGTYKLQHVVLQVAARISDVIDI